MCSVEDQRKIYLDLEALKIFAVTTQVFSHNKRWPTGNPWAFVHSAFL